MEDEWESKKRRTNCFGTVNLIDLVKNRGNLGESSRECSLRTESGKDSC